MSVDPSPLYPPEAYAWWWWLVVVACVTVMIGACWWCRRTLRELGTGTPGNEVFESVRRESLARIAVIEQTLSAGELSSADAHQRLGAEVRRFVGIVTNGDADYRVLSELRREAVKDPRLDVVVDVVARVERPAFAAGQVHLQADATEVFERAREVIEQWQ